MRENAEKTKSSFLRITELSLLLPGRQAVALQRVAQRQGLTVGNLFATLSGTISQRSLALNRSNCPSVSKNWADLGFNSHLKRIGLDPATHFRVQ